GVLVPRDHEPRPRMRNGGRGVEDVQVRRPAPLPPLEKPTELAAPRDPPGPRKTSGPRTTPRSRAHGRTAYFEPVATVRRLRPFFRRRLIAARPPAVLIRARNPCLFFRFRLRGRYVGLPMHCSRVRTGRSQ